MKLGGDIESNEPPKISKKPDVGTPKVVKSHKSSTMLKLPPIDLSPVIKANEPLRTSEKEVAKETAAVEYGLTPSSKLSLSGNDIKQKLSFLGGVKAVN